MTRRQIFKIALVASLSAQSFAPLWAQGGPTEVSRPPAASSSDDSVGIGIPTGAISAIAANDSSSVSLTIGPKESNLKADGETFASLTLTAPLDKDKGRGNLLSDNGFSNEFSAKFGLTMIKFDFLPNPSPNQFATRIIFNTNCKSSAKNLSGYFTIPAGPNQGHDRTNFLRDTCDVPSTESICLTPSKLQLGGLDSQQLNDLCEPEKMPDERDLWIFNVNANIGYNEFSYLEPTDFSKVETDRTSYGFSAGVGLHPGRNRPFFAAGYSYSRGFKAADKQVLCPTNSPDSPFECKQASFDAPTKNIDHKVFGLVRTADLFGAIDPKKNARAPVLEIKGTYEIKDKLFGVSVPLYLFLDKDKSFKGGVKVDWQEELKTADDGSKFIKDDFKFGIFISKSFDFLGIF